VCPYASPTELDPRRDEIVALWHEHQVVLAQLKDLLEQQKKSAAEIEKLKKRAKRKKTRFGGNVSERRKNKDSQGAAVGQGQANAEAPQGELADGEAAHGEPGESEAAEGEEPAGQPGHGPRPQPRLEEREEVFELDDADRVCTSCGGHLDEWEGQDEISTEIDVEVRVFVRKKIIKRKYRCKCGNCIETALGPEKEIPGGRYSLAFAIEVAHDKYVNHMPLERQARGMRRLGLEIESQTLWDQSNALAFLCEPAYEAIWKYILSHGWVGADDTAWPMLGNGGKTHGKEPWNAWMVHCENAVAYMIDDGRTYEQAKVLLEGYKGIVMCDGHNSFEKLAQKHPDISLGQCWSHARRKFLDCEEGYPELSREIIKLIAEMYALEETVPGDAEHDAQRKQMRQTKTRDVLDRICEWVFKNALTVPKESALATAIRYMVKRWVGLTRFVDHPMLPLDNNGSERQARAPALGRKNHYGSRSRRGTDVAAIMYTLEETAILSGVDPKTYLNFAAVRAKRDRPVVLPHELTVELLCEELGLTVEAAECALKDQNKRLAGVTIASRERAQTPAT